MSQRLLIVAHEATRTGSPRVLLELMRRVVPHHDGPVAVRLLADGPLSEELRALGTTSSVGFQPHLALLNSAPSAAVALELSDDAVVVAYIHEEGDALRVLPEDAIRGLVERCDAVWCVSEAGRADLVAMGVPEDRLAVIPPSVVIPTEPPAPDPDEIRSMLGISRDRRLVAGCGEASWRKGADLFVDAARRSDSDALWIWVGRRPRAFGRVLDNDVVAGGIDSKVRWIGEVADARPYLAAADLVVMPSREDPQPLVPLEAAVVGTATVGFSLGGLAKLAELQAMEVVEYPDTVALAALVDAVLVDPDRCTQLAATALATVRAHHDVDRIAERVAAELHDLRRPSGNDGDPLAEKSAIAAAEEPPQ